MNYARLTKLGAVDNPDVPTPEAKDFEFGAINLGVSIPIEYTCTGVLQRDVEVGLPVLMLRNSRNGVESFGIFTSSLVTEIEPANNGLVLRTKNSIYRLEWLDDDEFSKSVCSKRCGRKCP